MWCYVKFYFSFLFYVDDVIWNEFWMEYVGLIFIIVWNDVIKCIRIIGWLYIFNGVYKFYDRLGCCIFNVNRWFNIVSDINKK